MGHCGFTVWWVSVSWRGKMEEVVYVWECVGRVVFGFLCPSGQGLVTCDPDPLSRVVDLIGLRWL